MERKDYDRAHHRKRQHDAPRPVRVAHGAVMVLLVVCVWTPSTFAGVVRLWSSAVVIDDTIRLADLCELTGFDRSTERKLVDLVITHAPPAGGSRLIHLDMIRSVLTESGTNMATVTLRGAGRCAVTRPTELVTKKSIAEASDAPVADQPSRRRTSRQGEKPPPPSSTPTLRQAVIDHFNTELARYHGRANVVFDRTARQVLDLSGPTYRFSLRRRTSSPLGLVQIEVDVLDGAGLIVQTVPLVVQVSMTRNVVVARRAINQGATIQASDVERRPLSFARLDSKLGEDDIVRVIGQRAKRFLSAGTVIEAALLESIPLVTRGQLVTLTSTVGAIRVVTSVTAMKEGRLGETIPVRSVENKRRVFEAVVVGPGAVQVGPSATLTVFTRLAGRDGQ